MRLATWGHGEETPPEPTLTGRWRMRRVYVNEPVSSPAGGPKGALLPLAVRPSNAWFISRKARLSYRAWPGTWKRAGESMRARTLRCRAYRALLLWAVVGLGPCPGCENLRLWLPEDMEGIRERARKFPAGGPRAPFSLGVSARFGGKAAAGEA